MPLYNALSHQQKQEQHISASLIQGLNMLSLPTQMMYDYLVELSMANPMLEIPEAPQLDRYENILGGAEHGVSYLGSGKDPGYYDAPKMDFSDEEYDPYYSRGVEFESDGLAGSLKLQLSLCKLSPAEAAIGAEILGNLDDSGYFTGSLETICLLYCQPIETGRHVLSAIQGFHPRGIAASNVYEALSLQVDDSFQHAELTKRIINEDLGIVCDGDLQSCAKKYRVSAQCMQDVFDYIRGLEPRPGNCDERPRQINYIFPDIIVKREAKELLVFVSGEAENPLRINDYYFELLRQASLDSEEKQYLRSSLNTARALIHSVDIRRQTLHRAALSLVSLQSEFFLSGPDKLRPLTMQQLATEMGVNVSTVSRVVQDKYVSTPWGLYPLKHFFVRGLKGMDETLVSSDTAKRRIEALVSKENPFEPLTDDEISSILHSEGCVLSRRTVSKYRQLAGIPGCVKRRRRRV